MKREILFTAIALGALFAGNAGAQTMLMKDGRVIVAKSMRRQGDLILATQELPGAPGKAPTIGEVGYPIAQITKLDFPEPAQLKAARDLLLRGKAGEALAQLDSALRYYESFFDAPGSWWAELSLIKLNALNTLGRDKEADPIVDQLLQRASDPEILRAARVQGAAKMIRRGDFPKALETCDVILKESSKEGTLANAAIIKGQAHLALKQWDQAMLAFLQIPVLYPDERVLMPASMLGSGRAYFALEDYKSAKETLNDLMAAYGATPEAAAAKVELEKIQIKEKALESPK
ncbi:MAG: hypothetical protein JWL90_102 [Chthoniobacteraceae bacterium]|nr:hypothetical protein [Chthoniobacteraceae bacterium]